MRNSSSLDWLRFMHTPNDYRVSPTTAKYRGVSIEMISESLGHKSIKTTQIYLKGFGLKERTEVNKGNLSYIKNCCVGRVKSAKY